MAIPVGELPFIVVGIVQGKLQVAPMRNQYIVSSKEYTLRTVNEVHTKIVLNPNYPNRMYQVISTAFQWGNFSSWRYAHWVSAGHLVPRIAVFYRFLRENPSSANKSNMTDLRPSTQLRRKYLWLKK